MQRVCFVLHVRPERMEEYRAIHRQVWPEMQQALSETGWHNYSLFHFKDGMLIGYLETPDFDRAVAMMQERDVNQRWQEMMALFFADTGGQHADEAMRPLEELFHLA